VLKDVLQKTPRQNITKLSVVNDLKLALHEAMSYFTAKLTQIVPCCLVISSCGVMF